MLPKDLLVHLEKSDTRMGEILAKPIDRENYNQMGVKDFNYIAQKIRQQSALQQSLGRQSIGQQAQYNPFQQGLWKFVGIGQAIAGRPF